MNSEDNESLTTEKNQDFNKQEDEISKNVDIEPPKSTEESVENSLDNSDDYGNVIILNIITVKTINLDTQN